MNKPATERTPLIIAAEINEINRQSKRMLLHNAVEIGGRLKEAKLLLKHGEWLTWLKESVSYSKSTAGNLMRLHTEYSSGLMDPPDGSANSQPVGNFTYTQALLLLGLPEDEREEFVAQHDVANMSKQELRQTIREKVGPVHDEDEATLDDSTTEASTGDDETPAKPTAKIPVITVVKSRTRNSRKQSAKGAPSFSGSQQTGAATLKFSITSNPEAVLGYVTQCNTCIENIAGLFSELMAALNCLADIAPEVQEEKRNEARTLAVNLAGSLEVWPPARKPLKVISGS